jgi:putative transcriptional regulator
MSSRDIGDEIVTGLKEIKRYKKGDLRLRTTELSEPSDPKVIRTKLNLSQSASPVCRG